MKRTIDHIKRFAGRGVFPHQLAWFLELPWRRFVLSPQTLRSRLSIGTNDVILELGAGSGYYSAEVARSIAGGGQLHLVDLQPEMLLRCRQTLGFSRAVTFAASDASRLPFRSAQFDIVYMVAVLGEVADSATCLGEIKRLLKPTGVLSISEHVPDPDFTSLRTLVKCLSRFGFRLDARFGSRWAYTANFRL